MNTAGGPQALEGGQMAYKRWRIPWNGKRIEIRTVWREGLFYNRSRTKLMVGNECLACKERREVLRSKPVILEAQLRTKEEGDCSVRADLEPQAFEEVRGCPIGIACRVSVNDCCIFAEES